MIPVGKRWLMYFTASKSSLSRGSSNRLQFILRQINHCVQCTLYSVTYSVLYNEERKLTTKSIDQPSIDSLR